jgi:hypothetical protein
MQEVTVLQDDSCACGESCTCERAAIAAAKAWPGVPLWVHPSYGAYKVDLSTGDLNTGSLHMDVRFQVRRYYGDRITKNQGCCSPQVETQLVGALEVPSFGCGAPTEFADLKPGETVLDLGSGAGLDCFRAAEAVGETGRVIGVDMTPAMLARARRSSVWKTSSSARATSRRCRWRRRV